MNEHQTLDLRSPWVISIHELVRRPGELKEFHREIPAPANVGIEMIGVPEGSPVDVDLRLESVSRAMATLERESLIRFDSASRRSLAIPSLPALRQFVRQLSARR